MLHVYNHWETLTGIFPFDLTWQCNIPMENIAKSQFSIKTTLRKMLCKKQTELKTVSIKKKSHAWSHQHLWKPVYSVVWNLTGPWWIKCTTIKRSVWGKLETLCFLFHTRTQLTYIPHHKMQGCGNSALLAVWQKLKKKKGYNKIRNRNLESLILCKLFCNTGKRFFFYTSVSWFGVCGCQLTEINLRESDLRGT